MKTDNKLSNLQLELISMFNYDLSDEELKDIKALLADYFAKKVTSQVDHFFSQKGLDEKTIEEWSREHMRHGAKVQIHYKKLTF